MRQFRVRQVGNVFTPQMWCWWCPVWRSFKTSHTGMDWSEVQVDTLQHAKAVIEVYCRKYKVSEVAIYHYV